MGHSENDCREVNEEDANVIWYGAYGLKPLLRKEERGILRRVRILWLMRSWYLWENHPILHLDLGRRRK